jgi:hypothetical protein
MKENPKHKTKTTEQERIPLRPSPQLIDVSVYSSSSLEKQPRNGEESCTAVLLDNLSSTASQSLCSFHSPVYVNFTLIARTAIELAITQLLKIFS